MNIALSNLNRAALGGREHYGFVHWAAGAYVLLIGGYSVVAYWAEGEGFRAAMCAGAQVLAIVCAILARRALTGQMPLSFLLAGLGAMGCAWWSAQGLRHAWESNGTSINDAMVVFLAALEPSLFLLAEHIKEGREALREAHRRKEQEEFDELARIRAAAEVRERSLRPQLATDNGRALDRAPPPVIVADLARPVAPSGERPAMVSTNPGHESAREHALALKRANPDFTEEQAERATGVPRSTIGKWWRQEKLTKRSRATAFAA
jgi:hypothetical protein